MTSHTYIIKGPFNRAVSLADWNCKQAFKCVVPARRLLASLRGTIIICPIRTTTKMTVLHTKEVTFFMSLGTANQLVTGTKAKSKGFKLKRNS